MPSNVIARDGRFAARVTIAGEQRWLGTFDTEELAQQAVNTARGGRAHGRGTVAEWFDGWPLIAAARRERSSETVARTVALAGSFLERFGSRRLDGIARQEAVLWALAHPAQLRYARTILEDAVWAGACAQNPLAGVTVPEAGREAATLSQADVLEVARCARGPVAELILISAFSGLRLSECVALEARDLAGDTLHVRRGKGGKEGWSILFSPGLEAFVERAPDVGRLFPAWSRRDVNRRWTAARERAGVDGRFHDLRHFHATWLLERGVSEADVAMQLRHVGLRTVGRYLHPSAPPHLDRVRRAA